jgi:sensor c-di-GMP phosphodiesterase-like protein
VPKLRYKFKAFSVALIGMLLVVLVNYPLEITSKKEILRAQVASDFNWFKGDLNKQLKLLHDFFVKQDKLDPQCTPNTLLELRKAHFHIQNVAEFGISDARGHLLCTSWGKLTPPILTVSIHHSDTQHLNYFGPIHTDLIGEAALVISKTRSDGNEINALLPQSLLNRRINELDKKYNYIAITDAKTGVPISIVGQYTLPLQHNIFPLRSPINIEGVKFDDGKKHLLMLEPLAYLPTLTLMIAIDESVLYKGIYYPSITSVTLYIFMFVILFFITKAYQQNYQSRKSELKVALKKGDFVNFYQLIWDCHKKAFVSVETLARLNHPIEGILTPNRFLPDIESNDLNINLTYAVINNLLADSAKLIDCNDKMKVNINITGEHLKDNHFKELVFSLNEVIPHLVLEITENELVELDNEQVMQTIRDFKAKNIAIAIDDFGTGYAGIHYLKSLPLDILKIDRSYVSAIGTQSQLAVLLDALIKLAKTIELDIVAEGVETQAQADYLLTQGVYLHQGWLYHKASAIDDVVSSACHIKNKE